MKQLKHLCTVLFFLATVMATAQVPFTPGNLVVCRIGDVSTALADAAQPVFLDEYTTAGGLVQSIALPVTTSGPNNPLVLSANDIAVGALTLSIDGRYLTLTGFTATVGTSGAELRDIEITPNRTNGLVDFNAVV